MALAGEREGALDRRAVDRLIAVGGVLADDREQVAQELAIRRGQVLGGLVDGGRRAAGVLGPDLDVATAIERGACAVLGCYVCLSSLRYRRPSS
jgi:hypothetical protein